MDKNSYTTFIT